MLVEENLVGLYHLWQIQLMIYQQKNKNVNK